jgi:hypothetical protein
MLYLCVFIFLCILLFYHCLHDDVSLVVLESMLFTMIYEYIIYSLSTFVCSLLFVDSVLCQMLRWFLSHIDIYVLVDLLFIWNESFSFLHLEWVFGSFLVLPSSDNCAPKFYLIPRIEWYPNVQSQLWARSYGFNIWICFGYVRKVLVGLCYR